MTSGRGPWVLDLRAVATASIRVAGRDLDVEVRGLGEDESRPVWPALVAVWPALDYEATGERAVLSLEPLDWSAFSAWPPSNWLITRQRTRSVRGHVLSRDPATPDR
jgi:hypothetical protein